MNPKSKQILTVALMGLLAVFAAWGWRRKPAAANGTYATNFASTSAATPANGYAPATGYSPGAPNGPAPASYDSERYAQPVSANGTYSYASIANPGPCV